MESSKKTVDVGGPGMSYVGFSDLPNLIHRKSVKKGFEFTLLVVGRDGTGKTTVVNSIFHTDIINEPPEHVDFSDCKVVLDPSTVELEERGVKVRLTVVHSHGYGDSLNNTSNPDPIIKYIDDQFDKYFNDESGINRRHILDTRVHCLLYFIEPYQRGLKPLDVKFLKAVGSKVNVIPLIAKSDTLTKQELAAKKDQLARDIEKYEIKVYQMPDGEDDDAEYKETFACIKKCMPFAVCGSNTPIEMKNHKVLARAYPWGILDVENGEWTDCKALRTMIISQMSDLQEVTHNVHYENYRSERLLKDKLGKRMDAIGEQQREQDRLLREKDAELKRMQEHMARLQQQLQQQTKLDAIPGRDSRV
ncbi:septin-2-like isoform X2 [Paramacrobiotus metropolitanus]|uniref:septin-2-like isoform X2 n=1 Tax=Paramacrobiotus metropolitanus TaxID=2943436 RepID=UPI002446462A|nr:septin-2-like isoform X2 [Paramacrobiotus metropolitanus]